MSSVSEHYENHLADYYAWISGGLELKIEENRKFFVEHNIQPMRSGLAFDLGAGCGFQSIPLAQLGFRVVAMDLSSKLLAKLKANAAKLFIEDQGIGDNRRPRLGRTFFAVVQSEFVLIVNIKPGMVGVHFNAFPRLEAQRG